MDIGKLRTLAIAIGFIDLGIGILDTVFLSLEIHYGTQSRDATDLIFAFSFVKFRILAACVLLDSTRKKYPRAAIIRADIWRYVNTAYFVLIWGALVLNIKAMDVNHKPYFRWYLSNQWFVILIIFGLGTFIAVISAYINELETLEKKPKSLEDDSEVFPAMELSTKRNYIENN